MALEMFEVYYDERNEDSEVTLFYAADPQIVGTMEILKFLCGKYGPEMLGNN